MAGENLLKLLIDSLEIIAKITGGYATVTDKEGYRIKTIDSSGNERVELVGVYYDSAAEAAIKKCAISGISSIEYGAEAWCLPIGDYVLCSSNIEIVRNNKRLKESLIQSLPFISRVAGGEAVVFDSEGVRIATVSSHGKIKEKFLGTVSKDAKEAMKTQRPIIGESNYVSGANAVRIPITKEFGFGFNNEDTTIVNQRLINEVKKHQTAKYTISDIVGESAPIIKAKNIANIAGKSNSSVLIYGETGTGKELFAQSVHNLSERSAKPFVAINCAAIPANLMESNFFGYEGGSFTGAKREGSPGVFEQANGGTIFLDEISEMDLDLQSKILRVLQEREVKRIGSNKVIPLDIRVISATNKDLEEMAQKGRFRHDLFYRLNVVDINLPALREIKSDIPLIIKHTVYKMNNIFGKFVEDIAEDALTCMTNYHWPGNVRELTNCVERIFNVIGCDRIITKELLPSKLLDHQILEDESRDLSSMLAVYEKRIIEKALKEHSGVKANVARQLQISNTTLWRRMKELGIEN